MTANEVIKSTATHFVAVPQNGVISAGGGHFNALCGAVALTTGKRFFLVKETLYAWYNETVLPTLRASEDWHDWEDWHDFLREGLPLKG